jgi:hypothetical protein
MTKLIERTKAIHLRRKGKSYSEIKRIMGVSKSSLSLWLRDIPLTEDQIKKLKGNKDKAIERFIETMKLKREKKLLGYYKRQKKTWLPLSDRELFLAGLFLYWGEGNKASRHTISISNTDPTMLVFSFVWMTKSLSIPKESIKASLQLYSDMDVEEATNYWSHTLGISRGRFNRPYIKKSTRSLIDQKGFGHGTCTLIAQNTVIKENLLMAIKSIADYHLNSTKI